MEENNVMNNQEEINENIEEVTEAVEETTEEVVDETVEVAEDAYDDEDYYEDIEFILLREPYQTMYNNNELKNWYYERNIKD